MGKILLFWRDLKEKQHRKRLARMAENRRQRKKLHYYLDGDKANAIAAYLAVFAAAGLLIILGRTIGECSTHLNGAISGVAITLTGAALGLWNIAIGWWKLTYPMAYYMARKRYKLRIFGYVMLFLCLTVVAVTFVEVFNQSVEFLIAEKIECSLE